MEHPELVQGGTVLLSAGPRAGKTALLHRWQGQSVLPTQYLALSPDALDPELFAFLLLRDWPDIRARYEAHRAAALTTSIGALLAFAIADARPDFCLLIDDLHVAEDSALMPQLLALVRHFPKTGTLALASRHQLPSVSRWPSAKWEADAPCWSERPTLEDFQALPDGVRAEAIILDLVGDIEPARSSLDLVRRNIAEQGHDASLRLRAAWQPLAALAMKDAETDEVWDAVERRLLHHYARVFRTTREGAFYSVLQRLPSEVRSRRPYLLMVESDHLVMSGNILQGAGCLEHAASLCEPGSPMALDVLARQGHLLVNKEAWGDLEACVQQMNARADGISPLQQAQRRLLEGMAHLSRGRLEEACLSWQRVLMIPIAGDRSLAFVHYLALRRLYADAFNRIDQPELVRLAEQIRQIATDHAFESELLRAFLCRFNALASDESAPQRLADLLALPAVAFVGLSRDNELLFLWSLGINAHQNRLFDLAVRLFRYYKQKAEAYDRPEHLNASSIALLNALAHVDRPDESALLYRELCRLSLPASVALSRDRRWALNLAKWGRPQEALDLLRRQLEGPLSDYDATLGRVLLHAIALQDGQAGAREALAAELETPIGQRLRVSEALTLQELGLEPLRPAVHIRAFGEMTVTRARSGITRWTRKKALALLGWLILNPAGSSAEELAAQLFADRRAQATLHTTVYSLRQNLKSIGAEDILESARSFYRIRMDRIDFCDLYAFDAVYAKAQAMEQAGEVGSAAMLYELVLLLCQGQLFDNVLEEFGDMRAAYRDRVDHATAFLSAHRTRLSTWS